MVVGEDWLGVEYWAFRSGKMDSGIEGNRGGGSEGETVSQHPLLGKIRTFIWHFKDKIYYPAKNWAEIERAFNCP